MFMLFSQLCTIPTLVFLYRTETFLKFFSFSIVFDHPSHQDTEHVLKDRIRIGYWMITTDPYHITAPISSVADPGSGAFLSPVSGIPNLYI
jgi:hypothetical protein